MKLLLVALVFLAALPSIAVVQEALLSFARDSAGQPSLGGSRVGIWAVLEEEEEEEEEEEAGLSSSWSGHSSAQFPLVPSWHRSSVCLWGW